MNDHIYNNMNFDDDHQMGWQKPYDLKEAQLNGYCRVKIRYEWLRLKIVEDGKDGGEVWGGDWCK